jgi:hypothetical protein
MQALALLLILAGLPDGAPPTCASQPAAERRKQTAPKGVELYSWRAPDGTFRYSLLWGTNRKKIVAEIRAPECALSSVPALQAALGRLAQGEQVFWSNDLCPQGVCAYPAKEVQEALAAHARGVNISLEPTAPSR